MQNCTTLYKLYSNYTTTIQHLYTHLLYNIHSFFFLFTKWLYKSECSKWMFKTGFFFKNDCSKCDIHCVCCFAARTNHEIYNLLMIHFCITTNRHNRARGTTCASEEERRPIWRGNSTSLASWPAVVVVIVFVWFCPKNVFLNTKNQWKHTWKQRTNNKTQITKILCCKHMTEPRFLE